MSSIHLPAPDVDAGGAESVDVADVMRANATTTAWPSRIWPRIERSTATGTGLVGEVNRIIWDLREAAARVEHPWSA